MADPGFPVGGEREPIRGGVDLRRGCFLVKMYAKTKEFGPVGGGARVPGTPPRSANASLACALLPGGSVCQIDSVRPKITLF